MGHILIVRLTHSLSLEIVISVYTNANSPITSMFEKHCRTLKTCNNKTSLKNTVSKNCAEASTILRNERFCWLHADTSFFGAVNVSDHRWVDLLRHGFLVVAIKKQYI